MLDATQAVTQQDVPIAPAMAQQEEKFLLQSEVNKIVGNAKQHAYQQGLREASQQHVNHGGMTEDRIHQLVEQKFHEKLQSERQQREQEHHNAHAQKVMDEFSNKLASGFEKYPNFNEMINSIWPADSQNKLPELVMMLNSTDNAPDIIKDLYDNPHKVGGLVSTWKEAPHAAHRAMHKLSESIKRNETAEQNYKQAKEPLSQLKSSTISQDSGPATVSDLRKRPAYRG